MIGNQKGSSQQFLSLKQLRDLPVPVVEESKMLITVNTLSTYDDLIENAIKYDGCDRDEAIRRIDRINKERAAYHKYYTDHEWNDARCYDLCLNTSKISIEKCIEVIEEYLKILDTVK